MLLETEHRRIRYHLVRGPSRFQCPAVLDFGFVRPKRFTSIEWLGWIALAGLTVFFLDTSWRRWPDPLIDFGRELYIPWRLAHGAVFTAMSKTPMDLCRSI
jgi:hypothetical protein